MKKTGLILFILIFSLSCKEFGRSPLRIATTDEKLIETFKEKIAAIEKNPDAKSNYKLGELYSSLGSKYLDKKMWDNAIDALNNSLKNGKHEPGIFHSLAVAYANKAKDTGDAGLYDKAEHNYRQALEINSGYSESIYGLAIILFYHKDDRQKAVSMVNELAMKNPANYDARFALGRFHYELEDLEKSLQVYESLYSDLEKLPNNDISVTYKRNCRDNIERIKSELVKK